MTAYSNTPSLRAFTDNALIAMLGGYIRHERLLQNKTQQQLAGAAGINRSTLAEFENGKRASLLTFVQLLRALDRLDALKHFEVRPEISPLLIAEAEAKMRKRASGKPGAAKKRPSSDW
jgi:transcriptional regulator with XRE-family HTH domain